MDMEEETRRFKRMLYAILIFLVSAFFAWRELKYAVIGKRVDAALVKVEQWQSSGRRSRPQWLVKYKFTDPAGQERRESDTIPIDTEPPAGPTVPVQYLANTEISRLPQNANYVAPTIFFASLAFIAFKIFQLVRESKS